ncbi:MAG: hypothetical protein HY674_05390, partial [Chloroflexi bacterium]|nr:hypothetical protein [Chloroflexota bacterium]
MPSNSPPAKPLPQAVIFDLGKVLLDFDYGIAIQKFLVRCSLPEDDLHK